MKFDYCAMHAGSVIGEPDLTCRAIRHDDGTAAKPAEVWAEIEMLRATTAGIEEIAAALRLAIDEKRAFAVCVEGHNGSTFTLHNCDDQLICARMLERFARQQRGSEK